MMKRFYKLIKSLLFLVLLLVISSCDPGCVKPYEFDAEIDQVESHPKDFIENSGFYNPITGGQRVEWKDLGIRVDGNGVILAISGSWLPWDTQNADGDLANDRSLATLPSCNLCFKKILRDANGNAIGSSPNCLCQEGQTPAREELNQQGVKNPSDIDCSGDKQNDPNLCTCSTKIGSASDLDTFFVATDYQNKDGSEIHPNRQRNCKLDKGAGLYLGVFGSDGRTEPLRIYHLYSTNGQCSIPRNSENKCLDSNGLDITRYIYRSPNNKGFVRDDKSGNNGTDKNSADDEYHGAGEKVKLIIYDRYYDDNYGNYNVEFLSGIIKTENKGIIENIVRTIEDPLLGKISTATGKREDGAVKFLYENIVKDSTFITFLQVILLLYVTIFGFGVLAGLVEISRKQISLRVVKIALVLMFTTATSWAIYDQIVVGFFKNGMDSIIALFTSVVDANLGGSSMIVAAQDDRAIAVSNATRFSYMDYMIIKLLSMPVAKKIWGLFFGVWFGILYIPMIYGLIVFLIYVCLLAALIYVNALLKLIFVLALGPLFIIASLFSKTQDLFKRWLTFMASRGVEIIVLFLVVYSFLLLIDKGFNDLLFFESCTKTWDWWVIKFDVLESKSDRSFIAWISSILKIGALIFLMKLIIEKIPGLVSVLVQVNDVPAKAPGLMTSAFMRDANTSATTLFSSLASDFRDIGSQAVKEILPTASRYLIETGSVIGRVTGLNNAVNQIKDKIPFRSPITMARDYFVIDSVIKQKQKEGIALGKTGIDLDKFVRAETIKKVDKSENKSAILGLGPDSITKRLDVKLIDEPAEKFLKSRFEEMRKSSDKVKFGDELKDQLRAELGQWAAKNSSVDPDLFMKRLDDSKFSALINKKGELSTSDAARLFAGNDEMQQKYREHLIDMKYERENKAEKPSLFDKPKSLFESTRAELTRNTAYNPKRNLENFERKLRYAELEKENNRLKEDQRGFIKKSILEATGVDATKGFSLNSLAKRINVLDKLVGDRQNPQNNASFLALKAEKEALANYVTSNYKKDLQYVEKKYQSDLVNGLGKSQSGLLKEKRLKAIDKKKENYRKKLVEVTKGEFEESRKNIEKLKALEDKKTGKYSYQLEKAKKDFEGLMINNQAHRDELDTSTIMKATEIVLSGGEEVVGNIEEIRNSSTSFDGRLILDQIEALEKLKDSELETNSDLKNKIGEKEKERRELYNGVDLDELERLRNQSLQVLNEHLQALRNGNKDADLEAKTKEAVKNFYAQEKVRIEFDLKSKSDDRGSKFKDLENLRSNKNPSNLDLVKIRDLEGEITRLDYDISSMKKVVEDIKIHENQLK